MELPFNIVVAIVVAVIILLIIIALAFFVRDTGQDAIKAIWNIGDYLKKIFGASAGG